MIAGCLLNMGWERVIHNMCVSKININFYKFGNKTVKILVAKFLVTHSTVYAS